ncbi:PfkB family carbohydrate kinase [Candidatus Amarobacter glycogenicus]|uniref:PfkB family carbohydrate kinase n=1 Tax=Candidatus Amarobacter glycogenicus TaxID=3140699 RepID=UPI0031348C91|nr:sugar kinase [Dehalococcoidia bacterium]
MTMLVTGWVALDDIETPFGKAERSLGGSATATALAGALFTDVRILAVVGEDFPDAHRRKLEHPHIDTAGIKTIEGGKTSVWGARYSYDMNSRETWYPELGVSIAHLPPVLPEWRDSTVACLAAGHPAYQRDLIASLDSPKVTLVDTIKMFIDENPAELRETMRLADFVTLNESEARELAKLPSIARAGRSLVGDGVKTVIIKLGEFGAALISDGEYFVAPGFPLEEVIDPTGAGDSFAGAFVGYLDSVNQVTPGEIRRAMIYGSTVASFQVEGFGPSRLLTLTREEVEARYRRFRELTHFEVDG